MADKTDTNIEEGLQPLGLSIDWELYGSYLDGSDLTDDQKHDCIEALWNIVVAFVDLGFDLAPVHTGCEQNTKTGIFLPGDLIKSTGEQQHNTSDNHESGGANSPRFARVRML